jgi:hypothetical protein
VVLQQHDPVVAERLRHPVALFLLQREAVVLAVHALVLEERARLLDHRPQLDAERGQRPTVDGVRVRRGDDDGVLQRAFSSGA